MMESDKLESDTHSGTSGSHILKSLFAVAVVVETISAST